MVTERHVGLMEISGAIGFRAGAARARIARVPRTIVAACSAAAALHIDIPPLRRVTDVREHLVAEVAVVVVHRRAAGVSPVVYRRQAEPVLFQFIAQANRAADVPHGVIGILLSHEIVDEAGERLGRRRWRVLCDDGRHVADGEGSRGEGE